MRTRLLLCLLLVSRVFMSCSSDDSSSNNTDSQFVDKWWYSPDNSTLDVRFNSDGTYESVYVYNGSTITSDGEWEWLQESSKTFRVFNLQGNLTSGFQGKAVNLTGHSVGIQMSLDDGATFSASIPYVDTNN